MLMLFPLECVAIRCCAHCVVLTLNYCLKVLRLFAVDQSNDTLLHTHNIYRTLSKHVEKDYKPFSKHGNMK